MLLPIVLSSYNCITRLNVTRSLRGCFRGIDVEEELSSFLKVLCSTFPVISSQAIL